MWSYAINSRGVRPRLHLLRLCTASALGFSALSGKPLPSKSQVYGFAVNLVFKIYADSPSDTIFPPSLTLGATLGVDSSYDGGAMVTGTPATLIQIIARYA